MLLFIEATWPIWLVLAAAQMLAWHWKYRGHSDTEPDLGQIDFLGEGRHPGSKVEQRLPG